MHFYVSIGDIQDKIEQYNQTHNSQPSFLEIIRELYQENQFIRSESDLPDISDFAFLDDDEFLEKIRTLYFRFPDKVLTQTMGFDIVPANADLTVISQFWQTQDSVHVHDCFEINYIFKGECELTFLDEKRILKEGDFCILSPFTRHSTRLLTRESQIFPILVKKQTFSKAFFPLLSNNDILSNFFKKILSDEEKPNYLLFQTSSSPKVRYLIKELFLENFQYDKYVNQSDIHWLHLLFVNILRNYQTYSQFSSYDNGVDYAPILRYIQSHYTTVTLPELSRIFHYSVPYLSKIIKESTSSTFSLVVKKLRMKSASDLLEQTNDSIEEIATKTGYHSSDHFYRIFTEFYGMSPTKYRKKCRSNEFDNHSVIHYNR